MDLCCFHCGLPVPPGDKIDFDHKSFCCNGCRTVYTLFTENGLSTYYDLETSPGITPQRKQQYDFLENPDIAAKFFEFDEEATTITSFHIPGIHCSSCIWILENLNKLREGITASSVHFSRKQLRITFDRSRISLKEIAELLASIGYAPNISLEDYGQTKKTTANPLTLKLGVAFFSFGNIMLLSFPEYFDLNEFWLDQYKDFFRLLIFLLALPTFLYSASDYYKAAYRSLKVGFLSIEVPIAVGIIVMFLRSTADMFFNHGPGFFDSMSGLIFFMLLGKIFQSKTYEFLNFERDFRSYFPIAITRINAKGTEENVPLYEIRKGDVILVRHLEIIPTDGVLVCETASIDYSFVTGEATTVKKQQGDMIFAGGKQLGAGSRIRVHKPVSQSYLTQLWEHDVFQKEKGHGFLSSTDRLSRYFTPALLCLSLLGFGYWALIDLTIAFNVFTAVLIVACPCALALTAPFTLGNLLRIFGRCGFYLKNTQVIERLAQADTLIFDKTGTLTTTRKSDIRYDGIPLDGATSRMLKSALRPSNHPLSRMLYDRLPQLDLLPLDSYRESPGEGIEAYWDGVRIKIGSAAFTAMSKPKEETAVFFSVEDSAVGRFVFTNQYREGIPALFAKLSCRFNLKVLSGDNDGERNVLEKLAPQAELAFGYRPSEKLEFVKALQQEGNRVIMVGDGLNDAGALAQSDVGIAVSEDINVFSPACDAILDANALGQVDSLLRLARASVRIIRMSFAISLTYNVVGLFFALTGQLSPLFAAVIMPLSTVTIVSFVTLAGNLFARLCGLHKKENTTAAQSVTNVIFSPATAC